MFNLSRNRFLTISKWSIELRLIYLNPLLWKNTEITKRGRFFCTFLSVVNTLVKKISIINSPHLFLVSSHVFNSSVAFDADFLISFLSIPSKILRKFSLLFFGGNVAMWASKVSFVSNLVGSLTRLFFYVLTPVTQSRQWWKKFACWLF